MENVELTPGKYSLENWMTNWALSQPQAAILLCVSQSKISEWLSSSSTRQTPKYIIAHINTFNQLSESKAKGIIKKLKSNKTKG
jgi:predicted transcriptional regulator